MNILKKGSEGTEVANWQRFLISQGFDIQADGEFGLKTENATRAFQASHGLTSDGIVGPSSLKAAAAFRQQIHTVKPAIADSFSDKDLLKVEPGFASKVQQIIELAKADGFTLDVTQGLRTVEEQNTLFAKGRTRPGKVVTNARGGQSNHNYGVAADLAFLVNGKISWDEKLYQNIGRWSDAAGLAWGGNWNFVDLPHVELKGLPSYKTLLALYNQGGLQAVWKKYHA